MQTHQLSRAPNDPKGSGPESREEGRSSRAEVPPDSAGDGLLGPVPGRMERSGPDGVGRRKPADRVRPAASGAVLAGRTASSAGLRRAAGRPPTGRRAGHALSPEANPEGPGNGHGSPPDGKG